MPKRRKPDIDPRLHERIEDLIRRARESDREIEAVLKMALEARLKLRRVAAGR
ncbi:MAG: hypothetical protein WEB06_13775 [Actinomycetota bacterium]